MEGIVWSSIGLGVVGWMFWKALQNRKKDDLHDSDPLSFSRTVPRFLLSREDTVGPITYDVRPRPKAAPPKG